MRREPGPLYAFAQQTLYSVGIARVGLGIARGILDAFLELALRKTPCGTGRLADNTVMQAGVARADARVGAARANFLNTVIEIYRQAGAASPIDVMDRARARLAGSYAITSAVAAGDWAYKAAGVGAIFPGAVRAPFSRYPHIVAADPVARDAHYKTVGQVLLGNPARGVLQGADRYWHFPRHRSSFMPFCTPGRAPTRSPQAVTFLRPPPSINALRPA